MSWFPCRLRPALFVFVVSAATVWPAVALAHAQLEESDPAVGGTITTPFVLVARFTEEIAADRSSIVVRNTAGTIVAQGSVAADDPFTMVAELPLLPAGPYVAHWIALTPDDNEKTQGDIDFTVVAATDAPAPTPTQTATDEPVATDEPAARPTDAPTPSPAPTPPPDAGQPAAGAELIVPILLAGAVAAALAWYLLRRRR